MGSAVPPECGVARVSKLPGELKAEGDGVVMPQSGPKVYRFASKNTAIGMPTFSLGGG